MFKVTGGVTWFSALHVPAIWRISKFSIQSKWCEEISEWWLGMIGEKGRGGGGWEAIIGIGTWLCQNKRKIFSPLYISRQELHVIRLDEWDLDLVCSPLSHSDLIRSDVNVKYGSSNIYAHKYLWVLIKGHAASGEIIPQSPSVRAPLTTTTTLITWLEERHDIFYSWTNPPRPGFRPLDGLYPTEEMTLILFS